MRNWIIAALASAFALAANVASADAYFPPIVSGQYVFKFRPNTPYDAQGVPTVAPTRALAVVDRNDESKVLRCVDVGATRAEQDATYTFNVVVPATEGRRRDFVGFAYAAIGCTADRSDPTDDVGYVFFGGPNKPVKVSAE